MIIKRGWDGGEKERWGFGHERVLKMRMSLATKSRTQRIIKREAIGEEAGNNKNGSKDERKKKKKTPKSSIEDGDWRIKREEREREERRVRE